MAVTAENCMMIANMAKSVADLPRGFYVCPATENGFKDGQKHFPAKYVAAYVQQGCKVVATVTACVRVNLREDAEVLWKFGEIEDDIAVEKAREYLKSSQSANVKPSLVFLLEDLSGTDIVWDRQGGLQNTALYRDVTPYAPTDAKDLAAKLRGEPWSALKKAEAPV